MPKFSYLIDLVTLLERYVIFADPVILGVIDSQTIVEICLECRHHRATGAVVLGVVVVLEAQRQLTELTQRSACKRKRDLAGVANGHVYCLYIL